MTNSATKKRAADIQRMARRAGWPKEASEFSAGSFSLDHFARLVVAAERRRVAELRLRHRLADRYLGA